jgi:hypothetical protein
VWERFFSTFWTILNFENLEFKAWSSSEEVFSPAQKAHTNRIRVKFFAR